MNTGYLHWHPRCPGPMLRGTNGDERIDPWALACPGARPRSSSLVEGSPSQGADTHRCKRQRRAEMLLLRLEVPEQRNYASTYSSRVPPKPSNGRPTNRFPVRTRPPLPPVRPLSTAKPVC